MLGVIFYLLGWFAWLGFKTGEFSFSHSKSTFDQLNNFLDMIDLLTRFSLPTVET